jgi:phenylacetate-coenzyme A ligase PaaK-like adenylate-forming protein
MECEHGKLHQNFEFCRVDFSPLSDSMGTHDRVGRIFSTTFRNKWAPLLRFDMGDIVCLASGSCPCGRDFGMTLSAIEGRVKSLCVAEDGRLVTHRQMDDALARVDGLEQYRLVQENLKKVRLEVISEDGQEKRVTGDASDILNGLFGRGMEITVSELHMLLPEKSGKFLLARRDFPLDPGIINNSTPVFHV